MTIHLILIALLLLASAILLCAPGEAAAFHPAPADDFAAIQRGERTDRYLRDFDAAAERALAALDPDTGLLPIADLVDPARFDWSWAGLEREERKRRITPEYLRFYALGRRSAETIGLLGEAYALPQSRLHRDPRLLGAVRRGLAAFEAKQDPSGEWVFCPLRFATVYGSHEMAWRLEPLLRAYVCVQADLPPEERRRFGEMLQRACDFLLHTPCTHQCNRGLVWSGVMALAHAMTGDPAYLDAARRNWEHVRPIVFQDSGQVLEGPGPDLGYSTVSMRYAFLYRIMSGDASADDLLIRSLKWALRIYDANGLPFTGISTRNDSLRARLDAYLPALEYYAPREPLFDRLAGDYLDYLERRSRGFAASHGGAYALRAALFHAARPDAHGGEVPDYFEVYHADVSIYAAVRRRYQTLVTLRSRQPRNGLQMWTYGREKPLICPTAARASGTQTWAFDSTVADVRGREAYRVWHSDLDALAVERSGHYAFYVFSPQSTLVIYSAPDLPAVGPAGARRITRWVLSRDESPEPVIEAGRIGFAGQSSALFYAGQPPRLREERDAWVLEFARDLPFDWYAFSGGPFRRESVCEPPDGPIALGFSDSAGCYLALSNPSSAPWQGEVRLTWPRARTIQVTLGDKEARVLALGQTPHQSDGPGTTGPRPPAAEDPPSGEPKSSPGASP